MSVALPQETLLAIIAVQQEIAETDLALDDVMNVVAQAAARLTKSDAAVVELQEGDEMVYRAAAGAAAGFVGLRLRVATSLSGLCVTRNEPLVCDDCETDPRVDRDACRKVNARSMLVTPLRFRGTALGVLKVYSSRVAAFGDVEAETLRLLVGLIAASMHRAREYEGLTKRAMHDGLTGLPNRSQLQSVIEKRIDASRPFAVAFLDLDGFKRINDDLGHACGDRVLQTIASRITSAIRDCDIAARLGGDEFVVLLEGVETRTAAIVALDRLLGAIADPIIDGAAMLHVSATAGVAIHPEDGSTALGLLGVADSRMYQDKRGR